MAVDMFLKLDGIDGESTDKLHEKWIQVESFSWGVSNHVTTTSGGGGAGKAVPSDFSFVIPQSAASPDIFIKCVTGEHIKEGLLSCRKAGRDQSTDFLKYKLTDVLVSSYNTEGAGDQPMESISLNFVKIDYSYAPQNADGSLGTPNEVSFDFEQFKTG